MAAAVSAGRGGWPRGAEPNRHLARAGDGGQSGWVEGGGGAVIGKAGDRPSEAERPRGRALFGPPPRAKDGIDRLRPRGIRRRARECEREQRCASEGPYRPETSDSPSRNK